MLTVLWFGVLSFLTFQRGTETIEVSGRLARIIKGMISLRFYTDEVYLEKELRMAAHPIGFGILTVLSLSTLLAARAGVLSGQRTGSVFEQISGSREAKEEQGRARGYQWLRHEYVEACGHRHCKVIERDHLSC